MKRIIPVVFVLCAVFSTQAVAQRSGEDSHREGEKENAESTAPKSAAMLRENVLSDLSAWRHKQARKTLEEWKTDFGASQEYKTSWSILLAEEKKLDEAVEGLSRESKALPTDPVAPYYLGEIHSWKRERTDAKKAWEEASKRARNLVKKEPDDPASNFWLGASLLKLGKFDDAEKYLSAALEKGYEPAQTQLQLGLLFSARKKWTEAKDHFDQCIEADSGFAHAYYYRARVYEKLKKKAEMLQDLDRFLKLAPDAREAEVARTLLGKSN